MSPRLFAAPLVSLAIHVAVGAVLFGLVKGHDASADADPPPKFAGETFEVPELEARDPDRAEESTRTAAAPARAARAARAEPEAHGASRPASSPGARTADSPAAGHEASTPALFGAVGERGVVDLATAFTRGFPQAASADPNWTHVSFGSAGTADVTLEIDAAGQLIATNVAGAPTPALREGIARTLALIRARSFVATGAVTHLHIVSTVSPDAVHDGLHGDVFAIGGSFAGREGSAFFALAMGRRIDLTITRK